MRVLIPAAATAAAIAVAGCGSSGSPAKSSAATPSGAIRGSLSEWSVGLSAAHAAAGKVTFDVRNAGKVKHEFVVLRTSKQAGALGKATRIPETGHVGETGELAPGASKRVTLNLKPGHYSIVCNLPAHYRLGMHTDFTVS